MQMGSCVFFKEQIKARYSRTCQQKIFGNMEKVSFGETDQCPVAKKHDEKDIDSFGKCQQQSDVKTATEQGITGEVIMGKLIPLIMEKSG